MDVFKLKGGPVGIVAMFLMVATVALVVLGLRSPRTLILDATGFRLRRGKKEIFIPWDAMAAEKEPLKMENVMGWQRISIKATVADQKVTASLDQIFGVGLPVAEIAGALEGWLKQSRGTA